MLSIDRKLVKIRKVTGVEEFKGERRATYLRPRTVKAEAKRECSASGKRGMATSLARVSVAITGATVFSCCAGSRLTPHH